MKILVDADACPVRDIVKSLAKQCNIPVVMLTDLSHEIFDDYATVVTVDIHADSVDLALMNLMSCGDIVVTQDIGLASLVISKRGVAINHYGVVYNDKNIDFYVNQRYIGQKLRKSGRYSKGPQKRTKADDQEFEVAFTTLLELG